MDIGAHSVKAVQMSRVGGRLRVDRVTCALVDRNQLNADPVQAQASAVREALESMPVAQSLVVTALTGQTVVVRYPRLTDVPREQLSNAVAREAANSIPYDLGEVSLDWVVLDEYKEEERRQLKVLLVAAKHEIIDTRLQVLRNAEVECGILDVDSLALADAAEACDMLRVGETVAVINVGLTSSSVHFIKDGISNFIREVNWGSRELVQSLAKGRHITYEDAVGLLENYGHDQGDVPEALEALDTEMDIPSIAEEVTRGEDPFSDIGGGASLLDPLDDEFESVSKAVTDVFTPSPRAAGAEKTIQRLDEVLAAPLGRMGIELRRSFDYYEHQLYEQPVDRIILSGGPAEFPLVSETLKEELGFVNVDIARPTESPLLFGDDEAVLPIMKHPSQFFVAVGLAARGMADL